MNKRTRQYLGLLSAVLAYYIIHEGAHLIYALITGTFKQIGLYGSGNEFFTSLANLALLVFGGYFVSGVVFALCITGRIKHCKANCQKQ